MDRAEYFRLYRETHRDVLNENNRRFRQKNPLRYAKAQLRYWQRQIDKLERSADVDSPVL